ncbi:MAG: hypothetical protein ACFCU4_06625 [Puniceicoccaceae bacterium]
MLRALDFDSTASLAAMVAFVITFGAFLAIVWRTLKMKRKQIDHLASLPLKDSDQETEKSVKMEKSDG